MLGPGVVLHPEAEITGRVERNIFLIKNTKSSDHLKIVDQDLRTEDKPYQQYP